MRFGVARAKYNNSGIVLMGRAAKRKKQNVKQKQSASYEIQYQQQSSDYTVEQLQKSPTIAKLFDKIERMPQTNC